MKNEKNDIPEWLQKCMCCTHAYYRKNDADTLYCRLRNGECHFEDVEEKKNKKRKKAPFA